MGGTARRTINATGRATIGVALALWMALGPATACGRTSTTGTTDVPTAADWAWADVDPGPLATREGVAVGGNDRWLVAWGGLSGSATNVMVHGDGAVYDRTAGRWYPMTPGPLGARHDAAAVWSQGRLFIIGGAADTNLNGIGELRDGASFEPSTGTWRRLDAVPPQFTVRIDRSCKEFVETGGRLWTTCASSGAGVPAWRDGWATMAAPTTPVPNAARLVGNAGTTVLVTPFAEAGTAGRLRADVSQATTWVGASTAAASVAMPAGPELGVAAALVGGRVATATNALDRIRWFDPVRQRWSDGPEIPVPTETVGIGVTPALVRLGGRLALLSPAQDLLLSDDGWERIPEPAAAPDVWLRWAPIVAGSSVYVVSEPPATGLGGHRLFVLRRR